MGGYSKIALILNGAVFLFAIIGCESRLEITTHRTVATEVADPKVDVANQVDKKKVVSNDIDRQEDKGSSEPDVIDNERHPFVTIEFQEDSELIVFDNMVSYSVGGTCSELWQMVEISGAVAKATPCEDGLWSAQLDFSGVADGQLLLFADHSSADGRLSPQSSLTLVKHIQTEASIEIAYPAPGKQAGWMVRLQGSCSNPGASIAIKDEAGFVDHVTACEEGEWRAFVNLSAAPTGLLELFVRHDGNQGIPASAGPFEINKITSACDEVADRSRTFAQGLAGGSGSLSDPLVICTADQLFETRFGSDSISYILQNDIDFDDPDTNGDTLHNELDKDFVSGGGWVPADLTGSDLNTSVFDGGSFEIRNLYVNGGDEKVGLFTDVGRRIIKNLFILDANVSGASSGGIVARDCNHSGFYNVHVTGQLLVSGSAGGLCAVGSGFFMRTSAEATIEAGGGAGGILALRGSGGTNGSVIAESYFSGTISGASPVGGISGDLGANSNVSRLIINSHASGTVTGNRQVGGICGSYCDVRYSYSSANVVAGPAPDRYFGGIGGYGVLANHTFTTGELDAKTARDVGRIVGNEVASNNNNYFWSLGSCTPSDVCQEDGTGLENLSDFFDPSMPLYLHWDFDGRSGDGHDDHWIAQDASFPILWWQESSEFVAPFSGAGTASHPYLISSAEELNRISSNSRWMGAVFDLQAHIDLGDLDQPHRPIALNSVFFGTLNGHGYHVANFSFSDPERNGVGFIGKAVSASINNFHLLNATVSGNNSVGTVVGTMTSTIIERVHSSGGNSTGSVRVGGLFGNAVRSRIQMASSSSVVNGTEEVGGLVGYTSYTNIDDSYATGNVTGHEKVGGLVGFHSWRNIRQSYATGHVSGISEVGGLVGFKSGNSGHRIRNSFALGGVTGDSLEPKVGRLVGDVSDEDWSADSYVLATSDCSNGVVGCNDLFDNSLPDLVDLQNPGSAPLSFWDFESVWQLDLDIEPLPQLRF